MKNYYEQQLKDLIDELQTNDWVLLQNENRKKFQPCQTGPYKIKKICPLGTHQLEDVKGNLKLYLVHRDMLILVYVNSASAQQWYKSSRQNR